MNFRLIIGICLLIAFPAWMYYMIDKNFLLYVYSVISEPVLAIYLIETGIEKGEDK
jgi:hypothetical protein